MPGAFSAAHVYAQDGGYLAAITPIISRGRATATIKRNGEQRQLGVKSIRVFGEVLAGHLVIDDSVYRN